MRISKFKYLAVTAILFGATFVHAQTTTTETLTFDGNQMPSGWSIFDFNNVSHDIQIVNQRLEIGQVDTAGGLARLIDTSGVTQIKVEYDANIANLFWGQGTSAMLTNDLLNATNNFAHLAMGKTGFGRDTMTFSSDYRLANGSYGLPYLNEVNPVVFGNYHMSAIFENGQISQTVTNLDTGATFSSGFTAAPGFLLSDMHGVILSGVTTTGPSTWIDNATITVTAVPEPETYAMLLAGLGLVGAAARRRMSVTSFKA